MDKKFNKKIITVAFVTFAFIMALTSNVIFESLAAAFGVVAGLIGQDIFKHGVPVFVGMATFMGLQFNKKVMVWADEVVVELLKVVWPSRKDTTAMTIVVCIMLMVASVLLFVFDTVSTSLVKLLVGV